MMKSKFIKVLAITYFVIAGVTVLTGQQLPIFNHSSESLGLLNPATLSYDYVQNQYRSSIGITARDQWVKVPASPRTIFLRGDHVFENYNTFKLMLGGYVVQDRVGYLSTTGVYGKVTLFSTTDNSKSSRGPNGGFSFGAILGAVQYRVDTQSLTELAREAGDIFITSNPTLVRPDIGLGMTYRLRFGSRNKDYMRFGLSANQLLSNTLDFNNEFMINSVPHGYHTGSLFMHFEGAKRLEVTYLLRKVKNVPMSYSASARYQFHRALWLGAGVNSIEHINLEFGLLLDAFGARNQNKYKVVFSFNPIGPSYRLETGESLEVSLVYLIE